VRRGAVGTIGLIIEASSSQWSVVNSEDIEEALPPSGRGSAPRTEPGHFLKLEIQNAKSETNLAQSRKDAKEKSLCDLAALREADGSNFGTSDLI
jgi:hypothetical protein